MKPLRAVNLMYFQFTDSKEAVAFVLEFLVVYDPHNPFHQMSLSIL